MTAPAGREHRGIHQQCVFRVSHVECRPSERSCHVSSTTGSQGVFSLFWTHRDDPWLALMGCVQTTGHVTDLSRISWDGPGFHTESPTFGNLLGPRQTGTVGHPKRDQGP